MSCVAQSLTRVCQEGALRQARQQRSSGRRGVTARQKAAAEAHRFQMSSIWKTVSEALTVALPCLTCRQL